MNKLISSVRNVTMYAALALLGSTVFISCQKDNDSDNPDVPAAGLMAFNLSPDQSAIGFSLSGSVLTNIPLAYTNYTGTYLGIYPGGRTVDAYDANSGSAPLASVAGNFEADKYYSVFFVGTSDNYKNVLVNDDVDTLSSSSGQAFVRYINAIPDSVNAPMVTVMAGGSSVISTTAPFATASNFVAVNPGDIAIAVKNSNGIDASRTIAVEAKKVYTILLVGEPGASATPVEIKFISNGTLDDDSTSRTSSVSKATVIN